MSATDVTVGNIALGHGHLALDGTSLGATSGGINVSKGTTTYEVFIDQLLTPVKIVATKEDYAVKTNLVEATLAHLQMIWNIPAAQLAGNTLNLGINSGVVEHTLDISGVAPNNTLRVIHFHRVVSVQASEHGYFKDKETLFPVTFTVLADTTQSAGQEIGTIIDYPSRGTP